jgi:hypothetical protein
MLVRSMIAVLALAAAATGAPLAAGVPSALDESLVSSLAPRATDGRCATRFEIPGTARHESALSASPAWRFAIQNGDIEIPVFVHVVYGVGVWNVPEESINLQIAVLNDAYQGTGFQFVLAGIDRTLNDTWASANPGSAAEAQMKNALAVDPASTLNIYTNNSPLYLTGWSSFPWSYPEGNDQDGVVIFVECWAGGSLAPYNEGDITVHEVGHWLGLYHTFQSGCSGSGDFVDDTPPHQINYGCPTGMNSCSGDGPDPIENYMNYTDDSCMFEFTAGQSTRMQEQVALYRPTIWETGNVSVEDGPAASLDLGQGPNPFGPGTRIFFRIPRPGRVTVRVHDMGGRLIRTLGDADMAAGRHTLWWDGRDRGGREVESGVYFCTLLLDGTTQGRSRRMQLVR